MSEPPKLNVTVKRRYTLAISGTVGAGPNVGLTLLAGPISFPYRVKGAEVVFRSDTANLLQIYLLISNNSTISTNTPPADQNLLSPFVATSYLIGESLIKRVALDYLAESGNIYLKVHAINGCTYAQTVNVTIEIEEA